MRWVILVIAVVIAIAQAGMPSFYAVVPDPLEPELARRAIDRIRLQADIYYQERGEWPDSLVQLTEDDYLTLDEETRQQWNFELDFSHPGSIVATPNYDLSAEGEKVRVYNWNDPRTVRFDLTTGRWSGLGVKELRREPVSLNDAADMTWEVRRLMQWIAKAHETYYMDRGVWPESYQELIDERYVGPSMPVYVQWEILLHGAPLESIEARSSHLMPAGSGHVLTCDVKSKSFTGFGAEGREEMLLSE